MDVSIAREAIEDISGATQASGVKFDESKKTEKEPSLRSLRKLGEQFRLLQLPALTFGKA